MTDDQVIAALRVHFGWVSAGEMARTLGGDVTNDDVTARLHQLAVAGRIFEEETGAPPDCGCAPVRWGYKGKIRG